MRGLIAALLVACSAHVVIAEDARVGGAVAVERARYAFVLGATRPFDEAYPRAVFEARVARERRHERALASVFGVRVTSEQVALECDRIERNSKDLDQWVVVKAALANDRELIGEVVCKPLVVDRLLRARFAFDEGTHSGPLAAARAARARLIAGETVEGTQSLLLSRRDPRQQPIEDGALHPDALEVLERELRGPGNVSVILSERERFAIYRLVEATAEAWRVDALFFPKVDFERWLAASLAEETEKP